jgi:glutaredoxin 3
MPMIEIWGKPGCPSCVSAKQLCETRKYNYAYKELGKDFTREQVFETFPGARTFPQIIINGDKIGGFDQLVEYIESTGYTGTGHTL